MRTSVRVRVRVRVRAALPLSRPVPHTPAPQHRFNACPSFEQLREVFNTLAITIFGLINIAVLLFLLMFIYTVMGVQLFAKVAYNEDFNANANFRGFGLAFLTLFRYVVT